MRTYTVSDVTKVQRRFGSWKASSLHHQRQGQRSQSQRLTELKHEMRTDKRIATQFPNSIICELVCYENYYYYH